MLAYCKGTRPCNNKVFSIYLRINFHLLRSGGISLGIYDLEYSWRSLKKQSKLNIQGFFLKVEYLYENVRRGGNVVIAQGGVLASHPWGSELYPQHCPIHNSSSNNNKEAVCGGRWDIRLFLDSVYRDASLIWLLSGNKCQSPMMDPCI